MNLKIGDRVAVYGHRPTQPGFNVGMRYSRSDRGRVESIFSPKEVVVEFDDGTVGEVHPKQCRKLRKKEPPTFSISFDVDGKPYWGTAIFKGEKPNETITYRAINRTSLVKPE